MKTVVDFLRRLDRNNNREWFNAHKAEYLEAKARFEEMALELIQRVADFDPSVSGLSIKDCTYRIYRDTRFSLDKTPYKNHMGVFIVPGGKKSGNAGYYLQIGAHENGFPGGCMLASGNYCYDKPAVDIIREDIEIDKGKAFKEAIDEATDFTLDYEGALKKVPKGYDANAPYADFLRLKAYCLLKEPGAEYMLEPNLAERAANDFKNTKKFIDLINRAIDFSRNEF